MVAVVFALFVALVVGGAVLTAAAATGAIAPRRRSSNTSGTALSSIDFLPLRLALAGGGFIGVLLATGWPVAAFFSMVGGLLLPTFATAKRRRRESIERVEAIATWVESLRDTMSASAGMQQAIRTTAKNPPKPIYDEVKDLALRLEHQSVNEALRRFAADLRHPASDMVVAALILASSRHAGSLQGIMRMTARAARDSASMLRQVEAGRTRTYSQARLVGWATGAMLTFLVVTRRSFLEPFDTFSGQLAMTVVCLAFLGSGYALYQLGRPADPDRVFDNIEYWNDARLELSR